MAEKKEKVLYETLNMTVFLILKADAHIEVVNLVSTLGRTLCFFHLFILKET
ncbi:MAG: hypothetical protein ACQEXB_06370 [Bacillota bacterium]